MNKKISATLLVTIFLATACNGNTQPEESAGIVSLEKVVSVTPDDTYQYGAFCRVNYLESEEEFFVTFGGTSETIRAELEYDKNRAGGAEGGNGYSYKIYDNSFENTGGNGVVHEGGGDAASVLAEGYYYFLTGGGNGWVMDKIDPQTWETIDSVDIQIDEAHEATNDQMLAYVNGYLIVSSLYNSADKDDKQTADPTQGYATHNRIFDLDLNQLDYFILDDTPHINGSYVVYVDGIYNYITSTAYFGDIVVMQYDEDWDYLGVKTIESHGQWSQGAVYDETTERFYVAYLDYGGEVKGIPPGSNSKVILGIFDKEWNLIENIQVTDFQTDENKTSGRPSVILQDEKLYVSYDISTYDPQTHEENRDWQCEVSVYGLAE